MALALNEAASMNPEPITSELRQLFFNSAHIQLTSLPPKTVVELDERKALDLMDAIDAVHANLEREYEALSGRHRIAEQCVIEFKPHVDWGALADDLEHAAGVVRGMGGGGS